MALIHEPVNGHPRDAKLLRDCGRRVAGSLQLGKVPAIDPLLTARVDAFCLRLCNVLSLALPAGIRRRTSYASIASAVAFHPLRSYVAVGFRDSALFLGRQQDLSAVLHLTRRCRRI
jgi:hypothetical protein